MKNKTWLITGISSGLGKALAQSIMDNGDFVIGTFRNQEQVDEFNILHTNKAFAYLMDITKTEDINKIFHSVVENFGKIDVLVNNAGYGLAGAIEETSMEETRSIFEANFFGTLQLTQTFLPIFRSQRSGHIIQISSHGGFKAFPGFGIYNASKFALEGFSEALAQELAPLNIKLTIVEPGPFRTNFAGSSFKFANEKIEDYAQTAGLFREKIMAVDGKQEGDPTKASQAIIDVVELEQPPLRLPLGKIALLSLNSKIESVKADLNAFSHVAENAVF